MQPAQRLIEGRERKNEKEKAERERERGERERDGTRERGVARARGGVGFKRSGDSGGCPAHGARPSNGGRLK